MIDKNRQSKAFFKVLNSKNNLSDLCIFKNSLDLDVGGGWKNNINFLNNSNTFLEMYTMHKNTFLFFI